jgi:hypothetical protein
MPTGGVVGVSSGAGPAGAWPFAGGFWEGNGAVRGRVAEVRTVGGSADRGRISVGSETSTGVVSGSPG